MKRLLLALLIPMSAMAEQLPAGCYVADYYRTDPCWSPTLGPAEVSFYVNPAQSVNFYGGAISELVYNFFNADSRAFNCNQSLTDNESNRQQWIAYANDQATKAKKNDALIKKLRKACGSKCARIK